MIRMHHIASKLQTFAGTSQVCPCYTLLQYKCSQFYYVFDGFDKLSAQKCHVSKLNVMVRMHHRTSRFQHFLGEDSLTPSPQLPSDRVMLNAPSTLHTLRRILILYFGPPLSKLAPTMTPHCQIFATRLSKSCNIYFMNIIKVYLIT